MSTLPFPLNTLNYIEVDAIKRLLNIYTPDTKMKERLDAIKAKLEASERATHTEKFLLRPAIKLKTDSYDLMVLSRKDSPMLKFIECPDKLDTSGILQPSSRNPVTLETSEGYVTISSKNTSWSGQTTTTSITLTSNEAELLAAFLVYHMEKHRSDHIEYVTPCEQEEPQEEI